VEVTNLFRKILEECHRGRGNGCRGHAGAFQSFCLLPPQKPSRTYYQDMG
jgi:hypothetical protein